MFIGKLGESKNMSIQPNFFKSPFKGMSIDKQVTNPNIQVGRYSYYAGYYHGHSFDECARYLRPDRDDVDKLIIGQFCSIASGVSFIMGGNHGHRRDWVSTFPFFSSAKNWMGDAINGAQNAGDTILGNDVWIGSEAMIMQGIQIGDGAIVGARSQVTNNVPAYSVVAGNPATIIRTRFTKSEIKRLLEIKWWDWSEDQLSEAMQLLCSQNIEGLYNYWLSIK